MRLILLLNLLLISFLMISSMYGKRLEPKKVKPVRIDGVEYRAPNSVEKMGKVEAWLISDQKLLWDQEIYPVKIEPALEADVQWVFISSLSVKAGKLLISNERGEQFEVDLKTRKVSAREIP